MLSSKKREGDFGEDAAAVHLVKHGYKLIDRNFRTRNGEIDIVAIDSSENPHVLVFVEVKTRHSTSYSYGTPLEAINYFKLKALLRTAQFYKHTHRGLPDSLRIDAVTILLDASGKVAEIELVKNIS